MTARHQHVADDLRRLITSGNWGVGERLPAETQLAVRYRVSTPTLREALEVLRAEGLIEKFQGRGNFVRRPTNRIAYPRRAADAALQVIVSSTEVPATGTLAARFQTQPEARLTEFIYAAHRGDSPQSLAHIYVPHDVAHFSMPETSASPWGDDVLDRLTTAGVSVASSTDQVTARFPTPAEAQSLRIGARTPVLSVERTTTAADGHVVAFSLLVLPGDRTEVVFTSPTNPINTTGEAVG